MSAFPSDLRARLERHELACEICNHRATVLHHVSNRGVGMKDDAEDNLAPLCETCHRGIHAVGKRSWPARFGKGPLERRER